MILDCEHNSRHQKSVITWRWTSARPYTIGYRCIRNIWFSIANNINNNSVSESVKRTLTGLTVNPRVFFDRTVRSQDEDLSSLVSKSNSDIIQQNHTLFVVKTVTNTHFIHRIGNKYPQSSWNWQNCQNTVLMFCRVSSKALARGYEALMPTM